MADEAPAENAPAAEGAEMNDYHYDVYTTPEGYQKCQCLVKAHAQGGTREIHGTLRYMAGVPGTLGGYNGLPHGPHPKEGPPPSRETVLKRLGVSREETMCFQWTSKDKSFQIYSD